MPPPIMTIFRLFCFIFVYSVAAVQQAIERPPVASDALKDASRKAEMKLVVLRNGPGRTSSQLSGKFSCHHCGCAVTAGTYPMVKGIKWRALTAMVRRYHRTGI